MPVGSIVNSFGFYLDAGLTIEAVSICNPGTLFSGQAILGFAIDINALDISSQQQDVPVWFGSPVDGAYVVVDSVSAGVTNISVSAFDDGSVGTSDPTSRLYLATTKSGLDSAVGGVPLSLGVVSVSGGVESAIGFWLRYKVATGSPEYGCNETIYCNLHIKTQELSLATES